MIPKSVLSTEFVFENSTELSRTYKLIGNKIQGFTDGLDALKQAIYKVLNTERYEYPIYSFYYGVEFENLIGKDKMYVEIELKRRITECLLRDDRISNVDNFIFESNGDSLLCTFDVHSIYGDLTVSQEVNI